MEGMMGGEPKRIAFVGQYLLSFPGGAERSMYAILKAAAQTSEVYAYTFDRLCPAGDTQRDGIQITNFGLRHRFRHSLITEVLLNHRHVGSRLEGVVPVLRTCAWVSTQSLMAPWIASFCRQHAIPYHYYLRDSFNLHEHSNQERGVRRVLKAAKRLAEQPSLRRYRALNTQAVAGAARLVANTDEMARKAAQVFGRPVDEVHYPDIDTDLFAGAKLDPARRKYVAFVGYNDTDRGYDVFVRAVRRMPEVQFLVVGPFAQRTVTGNVTQLPWQKDVLELYAESRVVISVLRWNKTWSGRVPIEAALLGIPVITSSALPPQYRVAAPVHVLQDIDDVDEWLRAIRQFTSVG